MKLLLTLVLSALLLNVQAQVNASASLTGDTANIDAIAKGLAQIAMANNAFTKGEEAMAKAAEYTYKAQKTAWLDNFRASGNLNEYTLKSTTGTPAEEIPFGRAYWPRYNFGVVVPFGIFTNQPKQTKAQYYQYQARLQNITAAKQNIALQTITEYYNYVRNQRLFELQEEAVQDASFAFSKNEESFSKGEVTLEAYTATSRRYNQERANKVNLERELLVSKAQLEALLGMPLEAALLRVKGNRR